MLHVRLCSCCIEVTFFWSCNIFNPNSITLFILDIYTRISQFGNDWVKSYSSCFEITSFGRLIPLMCGHKANPLLSIQGNSEQKPYFLQVFFEVVYYIGKCKANRISSRRNLFTTGYESINGTITADRTRQIDDVLFSGWLRRLITSKK